MASSYLNALCLPDSAPWEEGQLRQFGPCFVDVVVCGGARVITAMLLSIHLYRTVLSPQRWQMISWGQLWAQSLGAGALVLALIPAFLINGLLGGGQEVAPYVWAETAVAEAAWGALGALLVVEARSGVMLQGRWVVRFAMALSAASELVRARYTLLLGPPQNYFYYLYIIYTVIQVVMAIMLLCWWWPSPSALIPVNATGGYEPLPVSDGHGHEREDVWEPRPQSPELTAGLWSRITFSWMSELVAAGYRAPLTLKQLWTLPPHDRVDGLKETFDKHWRAQLAAAKAGRGPPASLARSCWAVGGGLFISAIPWKLLCDASQFVGPLALNALLVVIEDADAPAWLGHAYAAAMFLGTVAGVLADNQHFMLVVRAGLHVRGVLVAAVHEQVLRLTPGARTAFSSGRIFTLASSDTETINSLAMSGLQLMSSPVRIAFAMWLLWGQLGSAALVAVAALVLAIPANLALTRVSATLLKSALAHTDERTRLEGELMGGMEVVKCANWGPAFMERIGGARGRELAQLWKVSVMQALITFILYSVPTIIPVATFGAYLLFGHDLSPGRAFTSLALFNVLRFPLFMLPMLVQQMTAARVSLGRLQDLLAADALEIVPPTPCAAPGEDAVTLEGDFTWDVSRPAALTDVKLHVKAGQLVVVVGPTGSGKSSLLSALLGGMQQVCGPPAVVHGRLAYVPQAPFIPAGTLRDNVTFGLPWDADRYEEAIQGACLGPDLALLPGGDMTELGDRGLNLSGGQKQRVSIARALYARGDVVVLDDPLSALDARVGRRVFEDGIKGQLGARGATVILSTNQLQFVRHADVAVFMSGGTIAEIGPPAQLLAAGGGFASMMSEASVEGGHGEEDEAEQDNVGGNDSVQKSVALPVSTAPAAPATVAAAGAQAKGKLTSEEGVSEGGVGREVLAAYVAALGGSWAAVYLLASFLIVEVLRLAASVWLSKWTGDTTGERSAGNYLLVYAALSGAQCVVTAANALDVARLCLRAAARLHDALLTALLNAPMSFFHTTPLGRIINRLTRDTSDVDRVLPNAASMALRSALQLASTLALVGAAAPFALPPLVAIMAAFCFLYSYFQAGTRQLKRLEAVTRSPVLSGLSEAVAGATTIRAFGTQAVVCGKLASQVDDSAAAGLAMTGMNRWLSVRLETLGSAAALLAAVVAVEQRGAAARAGLVLSFAMQVTVLLSMTLRTMSQAENLANSVERVVEYGQVEAEGPGPERGGVTGTLKPPPEWPDKGMVEFINCALRYRPGLPLVLRGVSFRVDPGKKVGVVGRTGAGKSSLLGCLFRLVELERGRLEVDGLDISRLPLGTLRQSIALIPQVAVLFAGSIRVNLSPFGGHSDAELWGALRRAHLAKLVGSWPAGLDAPLGENGSPLSAGQRQLLALARALLHKGQVLVLDEATANVDVETDALIQATLRHEGGGRTMLAIAHRLHTVIDYDSVLVLDAGRVAEYGPPVDLLAPEATRPKGVQGIFAAMVDDTGPATARFLRSVASGSTALGDAYEAGARGALERLASSAAHLAVSGNSHSERIAARASIAAAAAALEGAPEHVAVGGGVLGEVGNEALLTLPALAQRVHERAVAAACALKGAVHAMEDAVEEEEAAAAALAMGVVGVGGGLNEGHGVASTAHGDLVQALAMLTQVEALAAAAATAAGATSRGPGAGGARGPLFPTPGTTPLPSPFAAVALEGGQGRISQAHRDARGTRNETGARAWPVPHATLSPANSAGASGRSSPAAGSSPAPGVANRAQAPSSPLHLSQNAAGTALLRQLSRSSSTHRNGSSGGNGVLPQAAQRAPGVEAFDEADEDESEDAKSDGSGGDVEALDGAAPRSGPSVRSEGSSGRMGGGLGGEGSRAAARNLAGLLGRVASRRQPADGGAANVAYGGL